MRWRLPPRWVRRVVLAPAVVVLALLLVPTTLMLLLLLGAVLTWLLPGRLRILRVLWMVSLYILWDAAAVLACFVLWVGSGFGWKVDSPPFRRAHYVLARRMLEFLFWQVRWTLRLEIAVEAEVGTGRYAGRPVVVASRHAGPGDSFILVHALLSWFDREPMIVLKDTLQWDPAVDILLNRLPTQFVTPRSKRPGAPGLSEAIGELATELGPRGALLIFPEGGNVTPGRRARRIAALRDSGRTELADQAERMVNVMAPHAGGLLAALENAPDAVVVVVAHTGLDKLVTVRDIWRELPVDKRIVMKGFPTAVADLPAGRPEREAWLFDAWEQVDRWIEENEPAVAELATAAEERLAVLKVREPAPPAPHAEVPAVPEPPSEREVQA